MAICLVKQAIFSSTPMTIKKKVELTQSFDVWSVIQSINQKVFIGM